MQGKLRTVMVHSMLCTPGDDKRPSCQSPAGSGSAHPCRGFLVDIRILRLKGSFSPAMDN